MPRKRQAATPPPERDLSQVNLIKTAMLEMLLVHPRAIWVHCDFPPSDMERYAPDDRCPVVGTIGIPTTVQPYLPILDALRIHAFRAIQHSDPVSIGLIGTYLGMGVYDSEDQPGMLEIQQSWLGYLLGRSTRLEYCQAYELAAPVRKPETRENKFAFSFCKQLDSGQPEPSEEDGTPTPIVPSSNANDRTIYIRDQLLRHPQALYLTHSPSNPDSPTPQQVSFILSPTPPHLTKLVRRFIFRALEQRQNDEAACGMLYLIISSLKGEGTGMGLKLKVAEDLEVDEDSLDDFREEQEKVLQEWTGEEGGKLREAIEVLKSTTVSWDKSLPRSPIFTNPVCPEQQSRRPAPPKEEEEEEEAIELAEGEYIVESILDERVEGRTTRYFVKWKGYPIEEGTWERRSGLEETEALDRWEREGGGDQKRKKKRKS